LPHNHLVMGLFCLRILRNNATRNRYGTNT